jgi:hypothetical protein
MLTKSRENSVKKPSLAAMSRCTTSPTTKVKVCTQLTHPRSDHNCVVPRVYENTLKAMIHCQCKRLRPTIFCLNLHHICYQRRVRHSYNSRNEMEKYTLSLILLRNEMANVSIHSHVRCPVNGGLSNVAQASRDIVGHS